MKLFLVKLAFDIVVVADDEAKARTIAHQRRNGCSTFNAMVEHVVEVKDKHEVDSGRLNSWPYHEDPTVCFTVRQWLAKLAAEETKP